MSSEAHDHDLDRWREGLRMANPPSPEQLEREKAHLRDLDAKGWGARTRGFLKLAGPGYLQSAMTLGGGTAAASIFAGSVFGYQLLWVAPVSMLLGIVMLSAISYQTLSTGMRPFAAMKHYAGSFFAWGWALSALFASIIWHFPQYSLAAAFLSDIGEVAGLGELAPSGLGFFVLFWALLLSMMYGSSSRLIVWYERLLKYMVWLIVVCFAMVLLKTGITDWGALFRGFFGFAFPGERSGVHGGELIVAGLAAAVGVNMVFLYPYTLLARGWGREHRRLARFDLFSGMFLPYTLAASLMLIAAANTIHVDPSFDVTALKPHEAALTLASVLGEDFGRIVFDLGIVAMALSSITLHMICTGFVCVELFGLKVGSLKHRLAMLIPVPGVLGPVYWSEIGVYIAVPTTILCGFLLPLTYVGFILLQRNRAYLGDDLPRGGKGKAWIGGMVFSTLVLVTFLVWTAIDRVPGYFEKLFGAQ